MGALAALVAPAGASAQAGPFSWPLGVYGDRQFQRVVLPDAACGNGTQFPIFFSPGPAQVNGKLNRRVVIWMPGGGSTSLLRDGSLSSPINSLAEVRSRLNAPTDPGGRRMLFFDHAANDPYVGAAHWAVFPYCTQDFHSGRRTAHNAYDFTGVRALVREVETAVRGGTNPGTLEQLFPGLDVSPQTGGPSYRVSRLTIRIVHRGAHNFAAGMGRLTSLLAERGVDLARADVTVAGSSAGGFGAWYNARRLGDLLWTNRNEKERGHRLARLTIVPMSGSPTERVWDDGSGDIAVDADQVAGLDHRLSFHGVERPCAVAGGTYQPSPDVSCDDTLDLIRHYMARWRGLNLRIAPVINKEDLLGVRGFAGSPGQPGYAQRLVTFCKTVHRYIEHSASINRRVTPWGGWMWQNSPTPTDPDRPSPVHGFEFGTGIVPMLAPQPGSVWNPTLLEWINAVADRDRRLRSTSYRLETRIGLVENTFDPGTGIAPYAPPDGVTLAQRAACNV